MFDLVQVDFTELLTTKLCAYDHHFSPTVFLNIIVSCMHTGYVGLTIEKKKSHHYRYKDKNQT